MMGLTRATRGGRGHAMRAGCLAALPVLGLSSAQAQPPAAPMPAAAQPGDLIVRFEGLRSAKGMIRACLTRNAAFFLHCERDPAAFKASVAAGKDAQMDFAAVPPGDYALVVLHDENGNARVDTLFGIPREGVGFSRDPAMMFGPPKWDAARFHVPSGPSEADVRIKYFL